MKKDSDYFEGRPAELIFIAKRLKEALRLESVLTAEEIDFGVEADEYHGGVIFRRIRTGAFFYVLAEARSEAVEILLRHGFKPEPAGSLPEQDADEPEQNDGMPGDDSGVPGKGANRRGQDVV